MKNKILLTFLFYTLFLHLPAQVSLQDGNNSYLISFDASLSGVNAGSFSSNGLSSSPSSGQLDADAWALTGMSEGSHNFGQTHTSGDFARGSSNGNVSSGGLYAFNVGGGNQAIGIQATGSDWTPGTITLKVVNNRSAAITEMDLAYTVYVRNDQGRSNAFNFSYSLDNTNYQSVSSANLSSPAAANASPTWVANPRSFQINGFSLAPGASLYLRWSGADVSGSGSRDELALDAISIQVAGGGGGGNTGYYAGIGSETCADLKTALYNLINGHTQRSYASLWTTFQTTDDRSNDAGNSTIVWDMYTDNPNGSETEFTFGSDQCGVNSGEGTCYNREHTFPKSWWGGSTSATMHNDIFQVVPSDGWINSVRGNNPYGEVQAGTENQITNNGSRSGSSSITISGYSGLVFEPIDAYKGDIARIYFYMATRYETQIAGWENNSNASDAVLNGTAFPAFEPWAIDMLVNWHNADPVSPKEVSRNEAIFDLQGNRNPFVDHPEYVDLIWGTCNGGGGGNNPVVLQAAYFESGWDAWQDGGGDCYRYSGSRSFEGNYSILIRDNSGTASAMTSKSFDLTNYNSVNIEFSIYAYSMEYGEDFWLRYYNGSSWTTVETYARGTDFNNNAFRTFTARIDRNQFNFPSNARFRFQCDASSNADYIYVDQVIITADDAPPALLLPDNEETLAWQGEQAYITDQEDLSNTQFKLFPNPSSNHLTITWPRVEQEVLALEIYNIAGQRMAHVTENLEARSLKQDVSTYPKGMYVVRMIMKDLQQVHLKFVVK